MERRVGKRTRRGLVLGAGGFLGAAWTLGALAAVQDATGWDVRDADLIVGTSAGSVVTMMLRAGLTVDDLCAAQLGDSARATPSAAAVEATIATQVPDVAVPFTNFELEPCWPTLPRLGPGSLPLLIHAARNPSQVRAAALCAAVLPRGRRQLTHIGAVVGALYDGRGWPARTRVVATDYHTGDRVEFGRNCEPRTSPERAVMASCAVPCWYEPVEIGRVPYVDGAVYSPSNADLACNADCDEIWVLAPMASLQPDQPRSPLGRLERWWRRIATATTLSEVQRLRSTGARVHVLAPNADDLTVMGVNMMDSSRRAEVLHAARVSVSAQLGGVQPGVAATPSGGPDVLTSAA